MVQSLQITRELTTRLPEGGKSPIRIILDSHLRIPTDAKVTDTTEAQTWIVTSESADQNKIKLLQEKGLEFIFVTGTESGLEIQETLTKLYQKGVTDILLEGGSELNGAFLKTGLINKFLVFVAPKFLGGRHSLTPFAGED